MSHVFPLLFRSNMMISSISIILFLGLCTLCLVSSQFLQTCSTLSKYKSNPVKELSETKFTSRNLTHFFSVMPPFVVEHWLALSTKQKNSKVADITGTSSILEIGCGGGRTSLGFQSLFPNSNIVCLNKAGYGFSQSNTMDDLLKTLAYYQIDITCDKNIGYFHLPYLSVIDIGLNGGILPFENESFDIIISQNALDLGKFKVEESRLIPTRILRMLKAGGCASLSIAPHIWYHFSNTFPKNTYYHKGAQTLLGFEQFKPLIVMKWVYDKTDPSNVKVATILLYVRNLSLGIMIRKCVPGESMHAQWGCLFLKGSSDRAFNDMKMDQALSKFFIEVAKKPQTFDSALSKKSIANMTKPEKIQLHREYTTAYIYHLVDYLYTIAEPL